MREIVGTGRAHRRRAGPTLPPDRSLIDNADVVITYKEYPHVDPPDRAEELFAIIADAAEGKTRPQTSMVDCNMIGVYHTSREPVRGFVDKMQALGEA